MGAADTYIRGIHEQLGYIATWLPTTHISVGDVGRFDGTTFVPTSSLAARGIPFDIVADDSIDSYQLRIGDNIETISKAVGDVLGIASSIPISSAGIVIKTHVANSVILDMIGCSADRIADQEGLGASVLEMYDNFQWDKNLVVVTEVISARRSTLLVSGAGSAQFDLTATGDAEFAGINLANLASGFHLTSANNHAFSFAGRSGMTPMFRAIKVKGILDPDISQATLGIKRANGAWDPETIELEDIFSK